MRYVDRSTGNAPAELEKEAKSELENAENYFSLNEGERREVREKPKFKVYKLPSVKAELEKLFEGKCAYCESKYASTAPLDVEHYRPKGRVQGAEDHDGYWWLAAKWENLFPSCIDCNRKRWQPTPKPHVDLSQLSKASEKLTAPTGTGKGDCFPLLDEELRATKKEELKRETPLLLNPCEDNPEDHLNFRYYPEIGASIVFPQNNGNTPMSNPVGKGVKTAVVRGESNDKNQNLVGAMSIHVFGLNRLGLVQERTKIVRKLEFLATLVRDLAKVISRVSESDLSKEDQDMINTSLNAILDGILHEILSMTEATEPYSAVAKSWVTQFVKEIEHDRVA